MTFTGRLARLWLVPIWCAVCIPAETAAGAATLRVCGACPLSTPSAAAREARHGDTIVIEPGTYTDTAVWTADNLTIRGAAQRPHIKAPARLAEGKAVWVVRGNNARIENIEISGASVRDRNGAAIRLEGTGLSLENCYFHDNENGLLTGGGAGVISIRRCEFARNGYGDGYSHNIYVGSIAELHVEFSYVHHARIGHNLKSRAAINNIRYNFIGDETEGNSSYLIDLSNGGDAVILGNILQKGERAENLAFISHGAEEPRAEGDITLIHNTVVNSSMKPMVLLRRGVPATVRQTNNLYSGWINLPGGDDGEGDVHLGLRPAQTQQSEVFVAPGDFDYRLAPGSPAIDRGIELPPDLAPDWVYQHPAGQAVRALDPKPDAGAFEH